MFMIHENLFVHAYDYFIVHDAEQEQPNFWKHGNEDVDLTSTSESGSDFS